MLDSVRRHTSLLLAVSAIVVLATSQVLAEPGGVRPGQTGPDQANPAAAGNADTVDGRHAVGPLATLARRAGRLVATDAAGYLPDDIIRKATDADRLDGIHAGAFARAAALKSSAGAVNQPDNLVHWDQLLGVSSTLADGKVGWGEVANKPATLADGKVGWAEVTNKPAGFADGTDDVGFRSGLIQDSDYEFGSGVLLYVVWPCANAGCSTGYVPDTVQAIFQVEGKAGFGTPYISQLLVKRGHDPVTGEEKGNQYWVFLDEASGIGRVEGYRVRATVFGPGRPLQILSAGGGLPQGLAVREKATASRIAASRTERR